MVATGKALFLAIALSVAGFGQSPLESVRADLEARFAEVPGVFAAAVIDFETGDTLFIRADRVFHAASTMKTPVAFEVARQAERGWRSLDDSILVRNQFVSIEDGSPFSLEVTRDGGERLYEHLGGKRTLRDLTYDMLVYSSNLATNLVIDLVSADSVRRTMREIGAEGVNVLRGVEDLKAYEAGKNNTTTARGLAILFREIYAGDYLAETSRAFLLDILKDQHYNSVIPAKLPDGATVYHKTGSISIVHHDSGVVEKPDGRAYAVVLLCGDFEDRASAIDAMADASRMIYDAIE
ncbi:MAG: serine hydrolase [Ignavibacteriales bacterium]|nr:serine hydrolase [Ignavibacteriales bacterium]